MLNLRLHFKDPFYYNSYFIMANTISTSAIGFLFWILVARFYTTEEVGLGSSIISAMSLIAMVSLLGLNMSIVRFLSSSKNPSRLINTSLITSALAALLISTIAILAIDIWSPAFGFIIHDNILFAFAFIAFTAIWTVSQMMDFVFIAKRRAFYCFLKNSLISLLKLALAVALVYFFHAFGIIGSWGVSAGIVALIAFLFFIKRVDRSYSLRPAIDTSLLKQHWKFSIWNHVACISLALPTLLLPIMVVNLLGASQTAYFYMPWMIACMLYVIPSAVSQSLFTEGSHSVQSMRHLVERSYKFTFLLLAIAIIVLLLTGKWLLMVFGQEYSDSATYLLRLLSVSGIFMGINSVYIVVLRVSMRLKELVILSMSGVLAILLSCYFLLPVLGLNSVGYVWFVVQGIISVYVIIKLRRWR